MSEDAEDVEKMRTSSENISIDIRQKPDELSYLSMDDLANLVDKTKKPTAEAALSRDASAYKPMRDAVMHAALLTNKAKKRLNAVVENVKGRIKKLFRIDIW